MEHTAHLGRRPMNDFRDADHWPEAVVIFSSRDDVVAGYSPRLDLIQGSDPHEVHWREGFHDRCFLIAERLEPEHGGFRFRDMDGHTHELVAMTLKLYEEHVRDRTMGKPAFDSLPALLIAMRAEW